MITAERDGGIAVLRMNDGKANAMNPAFLEALDRALEECRSPAPAPLLLTGFGGIFSAGLDLPLLTGFDRPAMEAFLRRFHGSLARLFAWPAPVVAAVNGHAIAGGCILAMQADARVMARGAFRIGISELALGLALPSIVVETFRVRLGAAGLSAVALGSSLHVPEDALAVGLVDELASPGELEGRARERLAAWTASPPAFAQVKGLIRRGALEAMEAHFEEDARGWLDIWFLPETRRRLEEAVAKLQARKSARPD